MATYAELLQANANDTLVNKVRVAVVVAATTIMAEADTVPLHSQRLLWAKAVFTDPAEAGKKMMWPVLAQNRALTLAQINGATDADVQTAVDVAVNVFANGA